MRHTSLVSRATEPGLWRQFSRRLAYVRYPGRCVGMAAIWLTNETQRVRQVRSGYSPLPETGSPLLWSNLSLGIQTLHSLPTASGLPTIRTKPGGMRFTSHTFPTPRVDTWYRRKAA